MPSVALSEELQKELNEAVRDERAAFVTWNNAKEHLRKVQEKTLVVAEKAKKGS